MFYLISKPLLVKKECFVELQKIFGKTIISTVSFFCIKIILRI